MKELINNKFEELTNNGKLDEIVTKQVTNFINQTVQETLSGYGGVSKAIKEKLTKDILDNIDNISFVKYAALLAENIESQLKNTVLEIGIEPIRKTIADFVEEIEKKEWKLSEIIEKFIEEEVLPDDDYAEGEIFFEVERSNYGFIHISFDEDKNAKYTAKYRIMLDKDNKVCIPSIDSRKLKGTEIIGLRAFELFIFQLYVFNCTVEVDEAYVQTRWSTHD